MGPNGSAPFGLGLPARKIPGTDLTPTDKRCKVSLMTTATDLREAATIKEQEAVDSFERCDTDGFLSQWASGLTAQEHRANAAILDNGGVAEFPALFDLEGERVPAKLIRSQWGMSWALCHPGTDKFTGQFVSAFPKREATMARKGYREGSELAPARAGVTGSGTGLSGAASCHVSTYRTDDGTGQDERVKPVEA